MFGSGQFIPDDSYPSTYKGPNERKCVTDAKTNTEKFVSSPTPVSSCQEHLDQSRLSYVMADTYEAFLVSIKDATSINGYFDAVSRRECHDVADTVCADVQERKCQISQRPVQETVSRQQCSLQYKKDCQTANDIEKRCQQEFKEECHSVPEVKCVNLPRTVQETIHEEECSNEFDQECSTRYEQQCAPVMEKKCTTGTEAKCEVVNERKCETVEDEVCEDVPSRQCRVVNERKCSLVPKQECRVSVSLLLSRFS